MLRTAVGLSLALLVLGVGCGAGSAQTLVRDAEIEHHIRTWSDPIFGAASLDPGSVQMHLVSAPTLNAFVSGGQNIFLHTGLIVQAGSADALIGVIAHEAAHIAAGHLARTREAAEKATLAGLATTLITIGVGALGGGDDAASLGAAGIALGGNVSNRMFLQHSRTAEYAADAAALQYLAAADRPARPLVELLRGLQAREQTIENIDPYARTHPLTEERIQQILSAIENEPPPPAERTAAERIIYDRLVAKIVAFTDPPDQVLQRYQGDERVAARYARSIAHYRKADLTAALQGIDALLAENPDDPYFHELRGQMLLENGHVADAAESYRRATDLASGTALLQVGYAQAALETGDRETLAEIVATLERALVTEPANARAWRLLAAAHGRGGEDSLALLASAELALLYGRTGDARRYAERALKALPPSSPARQRAEDIGALVGEAERAPAR